MQLSEFFGMKVCYSTLKIKVHVFHRLAEFFFFFRNGELLKITLQFHKNYQNIFQNHAVFTRYTCSIGFPFVWWEIFSSIEWSEKNIKIFKTEKMPAVFLKILKMDVLEKATCKFFLFYFWWIVDNMDYTFSEFVFW